MTLGFSADLSATVANESFGIDDLRITEVLSESQREPDGLLGRAQASLNAAADAMEESTVIRDIAQEAASYARDLADAAQAEADRWTISWVRDFLQNAADEANATAEIAEGELTSAEQALSNIVNEVNGFATEIDRINQQIVDTQDVLRNAEVSLDNAQTQLEELDRKRLELEQQIAEAESARDTAGKVVQGADAELATAKNQLEQSTAASEQADREVQTAQQQLQQAETAVKDASKVVQDRLVELQQEELELQQSNEALATASAADQAGELHDAADQAYALNFNHQQDGALNTVAGSSELVAGQIHLLPGTDGASIAVLDEAALPERAATRFFASVNADAFSGLSENGFLIFDYHSPDDFKYAGSWASEDRWAIGEVVDGEWTDISVLDEVIESAAYELQIDGSGATLLVEGVEKLTHNFQDNVDNGQLGIGSNNSRTRFDQVAVVRMGDLLPPADVEIGTEETDAAINELF